MPPQERLIRQLYVKIDGTSLQTEVMNQLFRVEVDTNLYLPAMCVLHIHDANAQWTNDGPFRLGAELRVGVADEQGRGEKPLFIGEITGVEPEFCDGTVVDLKVRAYDRSHRLHRGAHTRTYLDMTDSDIVSAIAQAAGLQTDVQATAVVHKHVFQDGQTDMAFLRQRARRVGYDLWVKDRTLYFQPAQVAGDTVALEWGRELREFRPVLTLADQVSEVTVKGWDPATKREIVGQAQRGQAAPAIGESAPGGQTAEDAFGSAADLIVKVGVQSQSDADTVAQAVMNEHDGGFVEAEGECRGMPQLSAGCITEISALGNRFNGRYRITSARHVWSTERDYVTTFRVTARRADTLSEIVSPVRSEAPRWPLMTGIVTNNSDPDGQGRVKVKFAWLDGDLESNWAPVVGLGAGNGRGAFCLPEVNDEVLVGFEQGDLSRPLVIGGLWNGVDAPPISASDAVANGRVVQRIWVTRTGHKMTFCDENPAYVRIESARGHYVLIDDDNARIEIRTSGGNSLLIDDNGGNIKLQGASGAQVELSTGITIKSSGNMNIEASGVMTLKGATIELNP